MHLGDRVRVTIGLVEPREDTSKGGDHSPPLHPAVMPVLPCSSCLAVFVVVVVVGVGAGVPKADGVDSLSMSRIKKTRAAENKKINSVPSRDEQRRIKREVTS